MGLRCFYMQMKRQQHSERVWFSLIWCIFAYTDTVCFGNHFSVLYLYNTEIIEQVKELQSIAWKNFEVPDGQDLLVHEACIFQV